MILVIAVAAELDVIVVGMFHICDSALFHMLPLTNQIPIIALWVLACRAPRLGYNLARGSRRFYPTHAASHVNIQPCLELCSLIPRFGSVFVHNRATATWYTKLRNTEDEASCACG